VTTATSSMPLSQYDNDNISTQPITSSHISQPVQDHQISSNTQEAISTFFYKPPNDFQIYDINCKEIPISFELVSELLSSNTNGSIQNHFQPNNLHEFYFLKVEEKKCYKVTCELISHSLIACI